MLCNSNWIVNDRIKRKIIIYSVGDDVVLIKRKSSGYPAAILDNIVYNVRVVGDDYIMVSTHSNNGVGWLSPIKVHKTYMVQPCVLRDIKIDGILKT